MKIEFDKPIDIFIAFAWTIILVILIAFDIKGAIRVIFGLPFVIFIPGYMLVFVVFPSKDIDIIERIALSFGLSIAIVPLVGLILNYTPLGIRLVPIMASLSILVLALGIIAILRWYSVAEKDRFKISFSIELPKNKVERVLAVALLFSIILSIALLAYIIATPRQGERFTEFYILGPQGKAEDYPTNLSVNENASLIIGIVNHEGKTINYTIEVWLLQYSCTLQFDGIDDYVDCGNDPSLNITDAITIEAWIKTNAANGHRFIVTKWPGFSLESYRPWATNGRFVLYIDSAARVLNFNTNVSDGKWHHVIATYDSSTATMKVYIDGVLDNSKTLTGLTNYTISMSGANLYIGKLWGYYFNGSIDDVRIYNRALSADEVYQNYIGNVTTTGLVSWWKFNEGVGNIAHDYIGNNDGIIYGASWVIPENRSIEDAWFMKKIEVKLNSTPVNIEKEWQPQWEYNYSFSINKIGVFKLAFLLFTHKTEDFIAGEIYPNERNRLEKAYRECHIWIMVQ